MDYYQLLGISRQATASDIKTAYKQLARKYHPDLNPGNAQAEELFKHINAAYDTLSDPQQKHVYDMRLSGYFDFVSMQTAQQQTAAYRRKYGTSRRRHFTKEQLTEQLLNEYKRAMARFPLWLRYTTSAATIIAGFIITFYNRDRFENGYFSFLVLFGILLFFAGVYQLYKTYFVHLRARLLQKGQDGNYERRPLLVFLTLIVLGVTAHIAGTRWRKEYHLSHYQSYTIGKLSYQRGDRVTYIYIADNKEITASYNRDNSSSEPPQRVIILYSYEDPYLSRLYYELQ